MKKILVTITVLGMLVALTAALPDISFAQDQGKGGREIQAQAGQRLGYGNPRAGGGDSYGVPCGQRLGKGRGVRDGTGPGPGQRLGMRRGPRDGTGPGPGQRLGMRGGPRDGRGPGSGQKLGTRRGLRDGRGAQAPVRGLGRAEVCVTEADQDLSRKDTADASAVNSPTENSER